MDRAGPIGRERVRIREESQFENRSTKRFEYKSTDMLDPSISSTREAFRFPLHPPVAGGNYSYLKAEAVRCFYLHVGNACSMVG